MAELRGKIETIYWWSVTDVNGALKGAGYAIGREGVAEQIAAFVRHAPTIDLETPNPSVGHRLDIRQLSVERGP